MEIEQFLAVHLCLAESNFVYKCQHFNLAVTRLDDKFKVAIIWYGSLSCNHV